MRRRGKWALLGSALALINGCAAQSDSAIDLQAEEAAIRQVDQQLLAAAQAHDAAAFAARFAPDAELLFPNRQKATGRQAIQATVAQDFAMPGFHVTWEATKITISRSGDLAVSIGSYHLKLSPPSGPIEDRGKYMTVWRKVNDEWLVAADMINTDTPLPAS